MAGGDAFGEVDGVGGADDDAGLGEFADQFGKDIDGAGREARFWFVHNEDAWLVEEGARD